MNPELKPASNRVVFELDKLVRDGIYKNMLELDQKPELATLETGHTAKEQIFAAKLQEESRELAEADTKSEIIKEAADILEVWDSYQRHCQKAGQPPNAELESFIDQLSFKVISEGLNVDDIYIKQEKLAIKFGSFDDLRVVNTVQLRPDDDWVRYYQARPEQFRRLN